MVISHNTCMDTQAPRFVHVGSAGVTRPNRPGIDVDQEPPAVKLNDALGGILTYKLKVCVVYKYILYILYN